MNIPVSGKSWACSFWHHLFPGLVTGFCIILLAGTLANALASAGETDLDLLLEEFETQDTVVEIETPVSTSSETPEWIDIYGSLSASSMIRTDPGSRDRLAELEAELTLKARVDPGWDWHFFTDTLASHDLAPALGDHFEDPYRSSVERELEVREMWIRKSLTPWLDLKLGRQIVAWGSSEVFRLVDVVNPTDQREFAMTDVEDIRLGQTMTRMDMYTGPWNLTLLMVHGDRTPRTPEQGSDFYVWDAPLPDLVDTDTGLDRPGFAGALTGRFTGWDAGLYLARVNDDTPYTFQDNQGIDRLKYPKINMAGLTLAKTFGNILLKSEMAFLDGLKFSQAPDREFQGLDVLAGIEYSGFTDTTITLEMVNQHIFSLDADVANALERIKKNHVESALRLTRDFKNDTIHVTVVAGFMGATGQLGTFQRAEIEVDWSDTVYLKFGGILYHNGDSNLFEKIQDNDRIFFSICKDFSLSGM